jgi:hypothetical protein
MPHAQRALAHAPSIIRACAAANRGTSLAIPSSLEGYIMANRNIRGGDDATSSSSNTPAEPQRRHKHGGNMGAGKSGGKSFGSEKPEERDNNGSRESGRDWDGDDTDRVERDR